MTPPPDRPREAAPREALPWVTPEVLTEAIRAYHTVSAQQPVYAHADALNALAAVLLDAYRRATGEQSRKHDEPKDASVAPTLTAEEVDNRRFLAPFGTRREIVEELCDSHEALRAQLTEAHETRDAAIKLAIRALNTWACVARTKRDLAAIHKMHGEAFQLEQAAAGPARPEE